MATNRVNGLSGLSRIPYNIIEYLAMSTDDRADKLFKLLKYSGYDALSKPSLSMDEKLSLIWMYDNELQDKSRIYLTRLVEEPRYEEETIMKLYMYRVVPTNVYISVVLFECDFISGAKTIMVSDDDGYPVSRVEYLTELFIGLLNGIYVGGVGEISFSQDISSTSIASVGYGNNSSYHGIGVVMGVRYSELEPDHCK